MRTAIALICAGMLAGCEGGSSALIPNPTIENNQIFWPRAGGNRVLEAEVNIPEGITVDAVYLRYARHYWPGAKDAHDVEAVQVPGAANRYRALPALAINGQRADHLFWEWFIDYRRGQSDLITARSASDDAPHDMVIGCTIEDQENTLREIRDAFDQFDDDYRNNPGYPIFSHIIPASLEGQGIPMARANKVFSLNSIEADAPDLLLFAPRPQLPGEPDAIYRNLVTNAALDSGSRLAGLAWGVFHNDAKRRPRLGCVPSSAWFIHEAGANTQDGGMIRFPVTEDVKGEDW